MGSKIERRESFQNLNTCVFLYCVTFVDEIWANIHSPQIGYQWQIKEMIQHKFSLVFFFFQ